MHHVSQGRSLWMPFRRSIKTGVWSSVVKNCAWPGISSRSLQPATQNAHVECAGEARDSISRTLPVN
jgi:hypothetical protein